MKWIIALGLLCVAVASAQRSQMTGSKHPKQTSFHRGAGRRHKEKTIPEPVREEVPPPEVIVVEEVVEEPVILEPVVEEAPSERRVNIEKEAPVEVEKPKKMPRKEHPCNSHECPAGQECELNKKEEPSCVCIKKCPKQKDARAKVCTTSNVTFDSECEMERQKCLCLRRSDKCLNEDYVANKLDYFGGCKEFKKCTKYEMEQFPQRMREWLVIVMKELANRNNLNKNSKKLAHRAVKAKKSDKALHWAIPAIWKFCELDSSHDDKMIFQEMLPMRAPLKGMEHCTEPFLDSCATDSNGEITREAWMKCLNIPEHQEDEFKKKFSCHEFED